MNPHPGAPQWKIVREILDGALQLPASERAEFVRQAAGEDSGIVAEVELLLAYADKTSTLLDGTALAAVDLHLDLPPGHRLAHYEIERKLGAGGMGVVYLARDTRLGRMAALKFLATTLGSPEEHRRFVREARAASALNHPNIITIYEYSNDSGVEFIAMEYVRGTTLAERLKNDPPAMEEMLEIARQTATALAAAHAAGIVHRDLKPANIMLTADGMVKVLDFGIARHTALSSEFTTDSRAIVGTPAYMAPEVALGEVADHRADIFALGVILYEMAARQRPFQGKDTPATLAQVMHRKQPRVETLNPAAPKALGDLIERCLCKDKEERLASMAEAAKVLTGIAAPRTAPSRRWLLAVASMGLAIPATYFATRRGREKALSYTLEAQKGDGELPYTATTAEVFRAGWKFRLRLHAARPGYFYVLTETGRDVARVFPFGGAATGPVSATVTGWYVFDRNPGLEVVWVVWSEEPVAAFGEKDSGRMRELLKRLAGGVAGMAGERLELQHQ